VPAYENDVVRLTKGGQPFWLAGLGDQIALILSRQRRGPGSATEPALAGVAGRERHMHRQWRLAGVDDLPGTLARIRDDAPVIMMAHEPDIFAEMPDRVAVTISGHTHGGQVRLLGYSPVVPSQFGNRYAYGHIVEGGRNLVVSGGLGCSLMPVRFGVPPEIVVLDIGATG
jgi:predicted MPP superfamily phosphohydrolase